jgi:tetratricopeptide (TPR) repeat protein
VALFLPLQGHQFVSYDDEGYLTRNPWIAAGLTRWGVARAFTSASMGNWHPLTLIANMASVEAVGLDPGAHHLLGLLLHLANTLILFFVLRAMTGRSLPGALVSLLFAVHPLHVEPVAWFAERKELLATLFWGPAVAAHLWLARAPSLLRTLPVATLMALALLAKPTPVSLPFLLLLLDFWPLGRFQGPGSLRGKVRAAVLEKVPLFLLAAVFSVVTYLVQAGSGAFRLLERPSLAVRTANALDAYLTYLRRTLWPSDLDFFYPYPPGGPPVWRAALALLLLGAVTAGVCRRWRSHPHLATGWFWYLGTLVPMIGLVQVGNQALADRYTYVPLTGLFLALAWSLATGGRTGRIGGRVPVTLFLLWVLALLPLSRHRLEAWRDSTTLYTRSLRVNPGNWLAHNNLGVIRFLEGRLDEAALHFQEALTGNSRDPRTRFNLGLIREGAGRTGEAADHYRGAIAADPLFFDAHFRLGRLLAAQGNSAEAGFHLEEALRLNPFLADAHLELALLLAREGDAPGAEERLREAIRLQPGSAEAHRRLGLLLEAQGRTGEAVESFSRAIALGQGRPSPSPPAHRQHGR